jgi:hypothetical protein
VADRMALLDETMLAVLSGRLGPERPATSTAT